MRIIIAGGSGLLGRCLVELFNKEEVSYITTYNTRPSKNGYKINFLNDEEVSSFLDIMKPTCIINCIVERQTDVCEINWNVTKSLNIDVVDKLSRHCQKRNIHLIHISTDYVFDGSKSPYYVDSNPNPLQNYGISKLIAELRVKALCTKYSIIRVPVLYCDNIDNFSENAITLIGKKILNQINKTTEDSYSIRRPVYIPDFCKFILDIAKDEKIGTYHFYNPYDITNKYDMCKLIGAYLQKSSDHITPSSDTNFANRPYDTQLIDTQYDITKYHITRIEDGIKKCFEKIWHPKLNKDCFLLFDLDGTIVNTDMLHYKAYYMALQPYYPELSWNYFEKIINSSSIQDMFKTLQVPEDKYDTIRKNKYDIFKSFDKIDFIKGADILIEKCIDLEINFAIVTNSSLDFVKYLQNKIPLLSNVNQWITREDYKDAKPSEECYKLAIEKYYKGEKYKIGFENTLNGFNAIKNSVNTIYFITNIHSYNYPKIVKEDTYIIPDLTSIE